MRRKFWLIFFLIWPLAALAEPWSFAGTLAAGVNDVNDGTGMGFVDATLAIPLMRRAPVNFEIGTYAFILDGKRPHETYGAFVWDNRLRVGAVRPAYDAVLPSVFSRAAPYIAYRRAEYARAHATVEAMRSTAVPWGVSWRQSFGQTDLALSAHDATKGNFRAVSASVAHRDDGWQLAAAVEAVWSRDGVHDGINAKLGGVVDIGPGSLGLAWLHPDANDRPSALAVDMTIPISKQLDVLGMYETTKDSQDDAYGLAFDYHIRPDRSLLFAATDSNQGSTLSLTLECRF
jgi:hypothetical protein